MAVDTNAPKGNLRSAVNPLQGGIAPWATFTSQAREHVPELTGRVAHATYEKILTDTKAWELFSGTVLPVESYEWWLDPNGNDLGRVALLAEDFGLPVGPPEEREDDAEHTSLPDEFDFGDIVHEALYALAFGHYYFEWTGEIRQGLWRLTELAPMHPSTIREIRGTRSGRLDWVTQDGAESVTLMGGTLWAGQAPRIRPNNLIPFVFWPDATRRWTGRSLLRPIYRPWLCKDCLVRIDLTNHERAGGVPWVSTDERYAGQDLSDLQRLAAEFRVDEEGGAALPPGAMLNLARVAGSDAVASLRWHDEQMVGSWHAMVRQLGTTLTGSRALGGTFQDLEALFRRSIAEWLRKTVNRWALARWWYWNFGERDGPVLRFTAPALEASSETEPVPAPGADPPPEGGGPPPRAATARPSPRPAGADAPREVRPGSGRAPASGASAPRGSNADGIRRGAQARGNGEHGVRASGAEAPADDVTGGAFSRHRLPDRELRRQAYPHEVTAAVDFAAIEVAYDDATDRLDSLFLSEWLPQQTAAIGDAITYTRSGTARQRVRAVDMARIRVPVVGAGAIADVLYDVAVQGASEALAELGAQGHPLDAPSEAALRALVNDHAAAVAEMISDGLALAARRRAVQLTGAGMTPAALAGEVVGYLEGLAHDWERQQLAGAAQQGLNAGRLHVYEQVEPVASYYISALLDGATCAPCREDDGRELDSMAEVRRILPAGGNASCLGGPRCRCTAVAALAAES
ncbi:MAG: hypothetical protein LC798_15675 [Chloroflexi bacterium]|nr:hypothetical protein [Chloroflexota bacterium]